jgi:hypothetical protein
MTTLAYCRTSATDVFNQCRDFSIPRPDHSHPRPLLALLKAPGRSGSAHSIFPSLNVSNPRLFITDAVFFPRHASHRPRLRRTGRVRLCASVSAGYREQRNRAQEKRWQRSTDLTE